MCAKCQVLTKGGLASFFTVRCVVLCLVGGAVAVGEVVERVAGSCGVWVRLLRLKIVSVSD